VDEERRGRPPGLLQRADVTGEQVEGTLRVRQQAERVGATLVERAGVAQLPRLDSELGEGLVEL
jgi:hypothetical protein